MSIVNQLIPSNTIRKDYKQVNKAIYATFANIEQPYGLILAVIFFRENIVEYLLNTFDYNKICNTFNFDKFFELVKKFTYLKHPDIDISIIDKIPFCSIKISRNKKYQTMLVFYPNGYDVKKLVNEIAIRLYLDKTILLLIKNNLQTPIIFNMNFKDTAINYDYFFDLCYDNGQSEFPIACLCKTAGIRTYYMETIIEAVGASKHKKAIIQLLYMYYVKNDNSDIRLMLYEKYPAFCEETVDIVLNSKKID